MTSAFVVANMAIVAPVTLTVGLDAKRFLVILLINGVSVPDIVTDEFFNGILDQADSNCAGKYFYSRDSFHEALTRILSLVETIQLMIPSMKLQHSLLMSHMRLGV